MKYIIYWDAGFGQDYDVIDCDNQDDAQAAAYDSWREDAEKNAEYCAIEYTDEAIKAFQ